MSFEPFPGRDREAKLDLDFPCPWCYTLIGTEEENVRGAARTVLIGRKHTFEFSHASRNGKYLSFHVEVIVTSDDDRVDVGARFNGHADIKFVL